MKNIVRECVASSDPAAAYDAPPATKGVVRSKADATDLTQVITAGVLAASDLAVVWLAFCSAYFLRYRVGWVPGGRGTVPVPFADWMPFGLLFGLVAVTSLALSGQYRRRLGRDLLDELPTIMRCTLIAVGAVVILTAVLPIAEYSRLVVVYLWILLIPYLVLGRTLQYGALSHLHGSGWNTRRVLVVGTTTISKMVMQRVLSRRRDGYHLVGFLQESSVSSGASHLALQPRGDFGRSKCLGGMEDLSRVLQERRIDDVICALPARSHEDIAGLCAQCEHAGVAVKLVPDLFELSLSRVRMDHLAGIPLIDVRQWRLGVTARMIKRLIDLVLAALALVLVSPILLAAAAAIKLDSPGPVLANQLRVGKNGKPFTFFKLRSMHVGAEHQREALAEQRGVLTPTIFKDRNDPRRTRVGRFIRKWSIDELPQLLNVLRGDMSMVGP
ncbi:MAG: sugar transferase, partial [Chloroflexota bacterium]